MVAKLTRILYTLAPLKLSQYWGLLYYRLIRRVLPFKPPEIRAKEVNNVSSEFLTYHPPTWKGGMEFDFLNRSAEVEESTWEAPRETLLWHYNLHYFDYLNSIEKENSSVTEAELIIKWWDAHKAFQGVAWEPYPTSLRAVNLCKWGWKYNSNFQLISKIDWVSILDRHYQEIKRKLEYHIQGNHLFANIKALWFLQAALIEYRKKDKAWLKKIVKRELTIQFDSDGGHFELSPMYHRIMVWDLLDMFSIGKEVSDFEDINREIGKLLPKAIKWMRALSHPDSQVAFFNDSAIGIAPEMDLVLQFAEKLEIPFESVESGVYSGYSVATIDDVWLICDTAEVGAAIQPGHAHADTLSFELSIGLQRVFVNSGTSEYGQSSERLRQRSTSAHNTVVYSGRNSSDVWSGFRVGKKARVLEHHTQFDSNKVTVVAHHNGYKPVIHERKWVLTPNCLSIEDRLAGPQLKESYFYLHPNVNVTIQNEQSCLLAWSGYQMTFNISSGTLMVKESTWHPKFGVSKRNFCIVITWQSSNCGIQVGW